MARILLIDDEKDLLDTLEIILLDAGHDVQPISSAVEALNLIRDEAFAVPDMIVSDVIMPHMAGTQLLETIRNMPAYGAVPVVFISASVTPDTERKIAALANVIFLRKPFEAQHLYEAVNTALGND